MNNQRKICDKHKRCLEHLHLGIWGNWVLSREFQWTNIEDSVILALFLMLSCQAAPSSFYPITSVSPCCLSHFFLCHFVPFVISLPTLTEMHRIFTETVCVLECIRHRMGRHSGRDGRVMPLLRQHNSIRNFQIEISEIIIRALQTWRRNASNIFLYSVF